MTPQEIRALCNGYRKWFSVDIVLSCPRGVIVLPWHDNYAKEWGALGAWGLIPIAISYKFLINSRTLKGEHPGYGARGACLMFLLSIYMQAPTFA